MTLVYHGTRYLEQILMSDSLQVAKYGDKHVSLSWDENEARYWAELPRDDGDQLRGWIIVLDRKSLEAAGYVLTPFHSSAADRDENELAVMQDIYPLSPHVVEVKLINNSVPS